MPTVQVSDGSTAVGTTAVNDGGTLVKAGNTASDSAITKVIGVNELNTGTDSGSKVVAQDGTAGDKAGVQAANSGGAGGLAYFPTAEQRNFLLRGAGDTSGKINNSTDDAIQMPASEVGLRQVNDVYSVVKTTQVGRYSDTEFNVLARPAGLGTGRTRGTGAGTAANYQQVSSTSNATDDAASPTRAVPGELTYHFGCLGKPTNDDYKARDANES